VPHWQAGFLLKEFDEPWVNDLLEVSGVGG